MPAKRKPAYQHHKATGQAKVRIDGKDHYLGEFDWNRFRPSRACLICALESSPA